MGIFSTATILKELRKQKDLTQIELSQKLNLDQTTVSKWELGKAIPDTKTLIELAKLFDVSTDYLLGISSFYYPDKVKKSDIKTSNQEELLEYFNSLQKPEQEQLLEYARFLTEQRGKTKKKA